MFEKTIDLLLVLMYDTDIRNLQRALYYKNKRGIYCGEIF